MREMIETVEGEKYFVDEIYGKLINGKLEMWAWVCKANGEWERRRLTLSEIKKMKAIGAIS